jgi:hypothetical protein
MKINPIRHGEILHMSLCPKCERHFKDSGYLLVRKGLPEHMEHCEFCQNGMGALFGIFRGKKNRHRH